MSVKESQQFDYVDGQMRPTHAALFAQIAVANDRALDAGQPVLDIRYGPHPRQTLDLFRTRSKRRATIVYFHAGYWQSRDKSGFRFLAPPLVADGFDVAIVNYPLSPDMCVPDIVVATQAALAYLASLADSTPLILAGHSAGAHIATELGMIARQAGWPVAGVLAISGVYDMAPLIDTSLNEKLALDATSARAASPIHRVIPGAPPAVFAVGALETPAFREQTSAMHRAWADAGNQAALTTVSGADHFSILDELVRSDGQLRAALHDFV